MKIFHPFGLAYFRAYIKQLMLDPIRDAKGNYVAGRTTSFTPSLDVDMGEATGLLHAMQ